MTLLGLFFASNAPGFVRLLAFMAFALIYALAYFERIRLARLAPDTLAATSLKQLGEETPGLQAEPPYSAASKNT